MAGTKAVSAVDHVPPLQAILNLIAALEAYEDLPIAQLMIKLLKSAAEKHKKELGQFVREQEKAIIHDAQHPAPPPPDLKTLEQSVKADISSLEPQLVKAGLKDKLVGLHATHSGTVSVAQALVELAPETSSEAVKVLARSLEGSLKALVQGQKLKSSTGHPAIDEELAGVIRHLWVVHDNGYDVLAVCMRTKGVKYDPVHAARSTMQTPLRLEITDVDPAEARPTNAGGRPRSKGKAKEAKKEEKASSGNDTATKVSEPTDKPALDPSAADKKKVS